MPAGPNPPEPPAEADPYAFVDANPAVATKDFKYTDTLVLIRRATAPVRDARSNKVRFIVARDYASFWAATDMEGLGDDDQAWHRVVVPAGYATDFASVPWAFRWLVGQVGPWAEASVVHDYLCDAWKWQDGEWRFARRRWADRLMLAAMKEAEVGWLRHVIYGAVSAYAYWLDYRYQSGSPPQVKRARRDYIVDVTDDLGGSRQSGTLSMPEPPQG